MKKLFIVSLLLSAGIGILPLVAASSPDVLWGRYISVFPGKYAKDGKSFLYTYDRSSGVTDRFYVFDEDMQLVKEIEPLRVADCESKYFSQRRREAYEYLEPSGPESVYGVLDINGETTGLSIDRVHSYVFALNGRGEIAHLLDGTQVVALNFDGEEIYGNKYPEHYYKEIDGEWYECQQWYNGVNWGPFGEWQEVEEHVEYQSVDEEYINIIPESGGESGYYRLTRGIFGDDYHYVMPIYESQSFEFQWEWNESGWIYDKSWGNRYICTGYAVYDSSGKEVMSFKYPAGYNQGDYIYFFQLGDNRYIAIDEVVDDEDKDYVLIYRIGDGNSVSFVTAAPSTKVSPRNPKRGEKVSVTLDSAFGAEGAMVQVVSASGQTMFNTKIPAGQTQFDINTSGFSQGMYVVNVSVNGITKEAAKIIVR